MVHTPQTYPWAAHHDIKPPSESFCSQQIPADQVTSHLRMASLHVLVCFLGLVVLCRSDCFFKPLVITDFRNPPTGCVDQDGKHHDFDSEWVKDCNSCSCTNEGMSCCSLILDEDIVDIPDDCELLKNIETCSFKMVMKSDRTKLCVPT